MHHVSRPVHHIVLLSIVLHKNEELAGHMEGGAVGPNSSPLGDEERKVQMFQFLEETQVV